MTGNGFQMTGRRWRCVALAGALLVAACGRSLGGYLPRDDSPSDAEVEADAGPPDARRPQDAQLPPDAQLPSDAGQDLRDAQVPDSQWLPPDAGLDPCDFPCTGAPEDRPVYQFGECTPPLKFGCPAQLCTPGGSECGDGHTCQVCGAAACCVCAACRPACVFTGPAQGPLPEYLKISPTFGPAFEEQTISIEGFPFYVGALYYLARVGDSGDLFQAGGTTCSFEVTVPAQEFGMVPVWGSQYGGGDPWVLAGFFTFSAGDLPACTQPGFPCGPERECCETQDVPMGCVAGRCRRR